MQQKGWYKEKYEHESNKQGDTSNSVKSKNLLRHIEATRGDTSDQNARNQKLKGQPCGLVIPSIS